jgi:hypothetical protein
MAAKTPKMTAEQVTVALRALHRDPEWAFFDELRVTTGWSLDGLEQEVALEKVPSADQRLDAWTMNTWPSRKHICVAYEIKVSRADFRHEIAQPRKRELALRFSHQFFFATPAGLVQVSELPPECGLVEVDEDGKVRVVRDAPVRAMEQLPAGFVASLGRHAARSGRSSREVNAMDEELQVLREDRDSQRANRRYAEGRLLEQDVALEALLEGLGWRIRYGRVSRDGFQDEALDVVEAVRLEAGARGQAVAKLEWRLLEPEHLEERYAEKLRLQASSIATELDEIRWAALRGGAVSLPELTLAHLDRFSRALVFRSRSILWALEIAELFLAENGWHFDAGEDELAALGASLASQDVLVSKEETADLVGRLLVEGAPPAEPVSVRFPSLYRRLPKRVY